MRVLFLGGLLEEEPLAVIGVAGVGVAGGSILPISLAAMAIGVAFIIVEGIRSLCCCFG